MSNFGLIQTLSAPVLSSPTQPDLIKFEVQFSAYEQRIADVNSTRSVSNRIKGASIRQCIKPELLHSLCVLGRIEGATKLEDATDENVKKWFDDKLKSKPIDLNERVQESIDSVSFKQCNSDPSGAVEKFVSDIITSLDRNNASSVLNDNEQCKSLMNMLVGKLQPPELKQRMINMRKMWTSDEKCSVSFFADKASFIAEQVHAGEIARGQLQRKGSSKPTQSRTFSRDARTWKNDGKASGDSIRKQQLKRKSTDTDEEWTRPCLNPDCSELHPMSKCENTSRERKKELLNEFFKNKKAKKIGKLSRVSTEQSKHPDASDGRYRILLDGKVESIALADNGADFSAMPKSLFESLKEENPTLNYSAFKEKRTLQTAIIDDGVKFTASGKVTVSLTIIIPAVELPVIVRGIDFVVVDQDMGEVLLGRPFLQAIGFDFDAHLRRVRHSIHGKNLDEIKLDNGDGKLRKIGISSFTSQGFDDDPIQPSEQLAGGFGKDSKESIDKSFNRMKKEAKNNGLSETGQRELSNLLEEKRDCFRIKLGSDPPAKVRPLVIKPKPNCKPFRAPQRRYAPKQRVFISNTVQELEGVGAVTRNPTAKWASPALAVPKPGSDTLRFAVDLRDPNSKTEPVQSSMPHLDSRLQDTQGSKYFANIDFCHGYWQFLLAEESREMMSIQTPLGIVTPTRILQGGTDSGNHFQAVTSEKFEGRVTNLLQWLDDFLIYAKTERALLDEIRKFLDVCAEVGFKLHAEKTSFFVTEVKFCGRIITGDGIRYEPRNFGAIMEMKKPLKGSELQQLLCALNWMRTAIPDYARLVQPIHELLESCYKKAGSRKKRSISKIRLQDSWNKKHDLVFEAIKRQLSLATTLAHPKEGFRMSLFTDASDTHWSGILTQCPEEDCDKPLENQRHEPINFLSGAFTGSELNWSVPEKEGYAIVESMCRLDYLVSGRVISIFTDHNNLVYIYDPHGKNPGIARHTASKLMRWAIKLGEFRYVIEHVPGERNVWADMLTRWAVKSPKDLRTDKLGKICSMMLAPVDTTSSSEYDWPTFNDLQSAQFSSNSLSSDFKKGKDGLFRSKTEKIWIPDSEEGDKLKLRIMVAAHCGIAGHRKKDATFQTLSKFFIWSGMKKTCDSFVDSCLHCRATEPGKIVPRPLGHSLHATERNEILHFDYCYMELGEDGHTYVLILKDDFSNYLWLIPCASADAETTANALIKWFSTFGTVHQWISDCGSHFKNKLINIIRTALACEHHFTLPYCPWSNGSVEVVCRELIRTTRAITMEMQLPRKSWASIIPMVQSALNNSPSPKLGGRCPTTVFLNLPQDTPLNTITRNSNGAWVVHSIKKERLRRISQIEHLREGLEEIHRQISSQSEKRRKASVDSHNRKTGVRQANFDVGDFVLRGALHRSPGQKLALRWHGPFRVTDCRSDHIFEIEDLLTGKREESHARRIKFFRNKDHLKLEEVAGQLAYQANELLSIEEFLDIRERSGIVELQVKWRGFSNEELDWVTIESLKEDVPEYLQEYLDELKRTGTKRQRNLASRQ